MRVILWTICGRQAEAKVWGPTQTFTTKREAVREMELQRQPKTRITKDGHNFVFILPS